MQTSPNKKTEELAYSSVSISYDYELFAVFVFNRLFDKLNEKRMRLVWSGLEFRMVLNSEMEQLVGDFNGFH